MNKALNDVEEYVSSVEMLIEKDQRAKMALAEFLLCVINSPFDHLYMEKRKALFQVEGRMTSYYGTAGNGKSYACKYALKMLTEGFRRLTK